MGSVGAYFPSRSLCGHFLHNYHADHSHAGQTETTRNWVWNHGDDSEFRVSDISTNSRSYQIDSTWLASWISPTDLVLLHGELPLPFDCYFLENS